MQTIIDRCQLNDEQVQVLKEIHGNMFARAQVDLPKNLFSPRCEAYDVVQSIDAEIARLAPMVGEGIQKLLDNEKQGIVLLPNEAKQLQAVWQSYFILNPVTVH